MPFQQRVLPEQWHVEFISYNGAFPNLCKGELELKVNGELYTFGGSCLDNEKKMYMMFWHSGGECGYTKNYNEDIVLDGEWTICVEQLPQELQQYANEIDILFNDNVSWGCCGGCL